jgi:hypothetical protein
MEIYKAKADRSSSIGAQWGQNSRPYCFVEFPETPFIFYSHTLAVANFTMTKMKCQAYHSSNSRLMQ